MKRMAPVIGAALLIVLLVLVNRGISRTAHPDADDDDAPSHSQTQPASKPAAQAHAAGPGAELPPEIIIGDPAKAKHRVTVGWTYDEANQSNPQSLAATLNAVQQMAKGSHGAVSAEIVDLDVPSSERSPGANSVTNLGVVVDGKPVGPTGNPGTPGQTPDVVARSLAR